MRIVDLPPNIKRTDDGSLVDMNDGRVLFFSIERFAKDIAEGNCCFICGAQPGTKIFNNEHVIPDWILRRYKLHNHKIRLPNGTETTYGRYKVPCCRECNSLMAETFETPLSAVLENFVRTRTFATVPNIQRTLFNWLALIFLKTHLKDRLLPLHPDPRKGAESIASSYSWDQLHHLHCVARSFYTDAVWTHGVIGSVFLLPARKEGNFDYRDHYPTHTMLIR